MMEPIGIAGPVNLQLLADYIAPGSTIPEGSSGTGLPKLIIEFLKRGHKCTVFTLNREISAPVILQGDQLKIHICPARKKHRARDLFSLERMYLLNSIQKEALPFINAHWTYEYALAALDSGTPTIVTARDAPFQILRYNFTPYRIMRTMMAIQAINKTKQLTAVSEHIKSHIQTYFGYRRHIEVIPNGLPDDVFALYKERKPASNEKLVFAAVLNGWGRLKNTKTLLKAFSIVHAKNDQTELRLFGADHGVNGLAERWAMENQMAQGVHFIGSTEYKIMLQTLASEVDILVHPSLEESFSNAIIEALALGVSVIGGKKSGAVPSTLGFGKAGILVDMRSAIELSEAMIELASDAKARHSFSQAGWAYAFEHYRIETIADQYEKQFLEFTTTKNWPIEK